LVQIGWVVSEKKIINDDFLLKYALFP
jgi:hypothetical protein